MMYTSSTRRSATCSPRATRSASPALYLPTGKNAPRPRSRTGRATTPRSTTCAPSWREYFAGTRREFDAAAATRPARAFQKRVWAALLRHPVRRDDELRRDGRRDRRAHARRARSGWRTGRTRSRSSCRAIGSIGANGSLTGYGGGLDAKRWLLAHEARARRAARPLAAVA